jgi:hypothetical protein
MVDNIMVLSEPSIVYTQYAASENRVRNFFRDGILREFEWSLSIRYIVRYSSVWGPSRKLTYEIFNIRRQITTTITVLPDVAL